MVGRWVGRSVGRTVGWPVCFVLTSGRAGGSAMCDRFCCMYIITAIFIYLIFFLMPSGITFFFSPAGLKRV